MGFVFCMYGTCVYTHIMWLLVHLLYSCALKMHTYTYTGAPTDTTMTYYPSLPLVVAVMCLAPFRVKEKVFIRNSLGKLSCLIAIKFRIRELCRVKYLQFVFDVCEA